MQEKLFLELRKTKLEIKTSLKNKEKEDWLTSIFKEEIEDIDAALKKITDGNYGQCEISGELLPFELLEMIPTLKSAKDSEGLGMYYKKAISPSFL